MQNAGRVRRLGWSVKSMVGDTSSSPSDNGKEKGFYCATAFATVISQTGDWDILSAGLALVVVEVIGAIMYRASSRFFDRFRSLITMFNYWKAGLSLGLFLDSFKYEVDMLIEKCNAFNVGVDVLSLVWSCFSLLNVLCHAWF
ncbi:hypothetical protein HPP92_014445 [Vanilla planifolia]|uniref:Uncharacterized protein n=1 Tax=Vanilla planifolia TaxID=51239 RepID=A0A835QJD0_VANPL|nr:hypothetical protein HPP92_014445 [Vanilla planifolia]